MDERPTPVRGEAKVRIGDDSEDEPRPRIDVGEAADERVADDRVRGERDREKRRAPQVHCAPFDRLPVKASARERGVYGGPGVARPAGTICENQ